MSGSTSVAEPPCPDAAAVSVTRPRSEADRPLRVERCPVATIPEADWERLASANPWSTPFSGYGFQRAWWDAYGANATDETLVVRSTTTSDRVAILPLMRRQEHRSRATGPDGQSRQSHEPSLTPAPGSSGALYMGASYHADYATLLAAPSDMPQACRAIVDHLAAAGGVQSGDIVDLRRWRCGDPAADELAAAFGAREMAEGWTLNLEREDVCPVAAIPEGADFDGFLATLRTKDRHEIRRKIRRAEAAGSVRFDVSTEPVADLDAFIDLHQARWGDEGLFPATPGGNQSRRFIRRLFELASADGQVGLTFLSVGDRRIAAGVHFLTADSILYYNAGVDPGVRDLSPGVLLVAGYVRLAIETGRRRIDFLRGDEPYKYQWGAVDEPIRRLLVRPTAVPA